MEHTPVKSSNLVSIGHDPSEGIIEVQVRSGKTYQYKAGSETAKIHDRFLKASSKGKFFHAVVKKLPYRLKGEKEWHT